MCRWEAKHCHRSGFAAGTAWTEISISYRLGLGFDNDDEVEAITS